MPHSDDFLMIAQLIDVLTCCKPWQLARQYSNCYECGEIPNTKALGRLPCVDSAGRHGLDQVRPAQFFMKTP
jgi:hypothetical protein